MDIPLRCLDVVMSHQLLHNLDVRPLLQQMCGKGVAQQVRINPFRDARLLCGGFQPFRHDAFRKGFARPALEEPHFRLIQTVVFRQLLHQWFGQQGIGRMATAFFSFWAALIKIYSYFRLYTFMSIYVKNSC